MIHIGGNNIPNDNPQILSEKPIGILKHTQGIMPETVLHFSALLPRIGDNYLPGIFDVNRNVREFCISNNIKFIPHYDFHIINGPPDHITYNMNNKLFIGDKTHPTKKGSTVIAKNFISSYRNYKE